MMSQGGVSKGAFDYIHAMQVLLGSVVVLLVVGVGRRQIINLIPL